MSIEFTDKPCIFCPDKCPHAQLEISMDIFYADGEPVETTNRLVCVNEPVCGMWSKMYKVECDETKTPN